MGSYFDLSRIGLLERKSEKLTNQRQKSSNENQEFAKLLTNKKSDYSSKEIRQQAKSPNGRIKNKFDTLNKTIVNYIQTSKTGENRVKVKGTSEGENDLLNQISQLADLLNQVTKFLQQFVNYKQNIDSSDGNSNLTNNLTDFNNLLSKLDQIEEQFPLVQELFANLTSGNTGFSLENNEITENQTIKNNLSDLFVTLGDKEKTFLNNLAQLFTDNQNEFDKVLNELDDNFTNLTKTVADLSTKTQDPNVKDVLTKLENVISIVQPKINLLQSIPSIIPKIKDVSEEFIKERDKDADKIEVLEGVDNQNHVVTSKKSSDIDSDIIASSLENEAKANNQKNIHIVTEKNPDKQIIQGNDVNKEQDIQIPLINDNQTGNKQLLNVQDIQDIVKAQLVNTKETSNENVFNQLVQKATLMVKEGFSEMKMQLKPESLGKVDLQISVERGIVTAKFSAESQQVKELIEANLSNLKQNLTNQGLKIDQISVAIGNQPNLNDNSKRPNQHQTNKTTKKYNLDDGESYGLVLSNELDGLTKQWYSESTVDYTA